MMEYRCYQRVVIPVAVAVSLFFLLGSCSCNNVSAIFIFGDSLADSGNNEYLDTIARPAYPNGIDFGTGNSSGRYGNGRTLPDIIGQKLGFKKFIPPFLDPKTVGDVILKGVNFASSGSGIKDETGENYGERIPLDKQIFHFSRIREDIIVRIGTKNANQLLNQAVFIVLTGSNDVIGSGDHSNNSTRQEYLYSLISKFRSQLASLYALGAKKIIISNVPVIGCVPFVKDRIRVSDGCDPTYNQISQSFNLQLQRLITELNDDLDGSKFVCLNFYGTMQEILDNFTRYGFEDAENACCNSGGRHGGYTECRGTSRVCADRRKFVFWDAFHTTDAALLIAAKYFMLGGSKFVLPYNIQTLVNF